MKIARETKVKAYSFWQISALTFLRILIGWHFLFEGLVKVYNPVWTAKGFLFGSVGPLAPLFRGIAQSESLLNIVDFLNQWGLVLIGLSLFVGLFSKISKISGIFLLFLFYLAYPPFPELMSEIYQEGSYWIVNQNLVEIGALLVLLMFPSSQITGMDRFIFKRNKELQ